MGKRKKGSFENNLKGIAALIICAILFFAGAKVEALQVFNEAFSNTEIGNLILESNEINNQGVTKETEIIENISENIKLDLDKMNVLFLDVGQADSQLIIYKDKTMLIDAGNVGDGNEITKAIKSLGINQLDCVIGTHVHEDHIGGMSDIIDEFDIGKFYLPYNETSTNKYYENLLISLTNKNLNINEAVIGDKIYLDELCFEIMSVDNEEPENTNESSIVVELTYGEQKFLFMGDAEKENEEARKWNDVDVLKVGHHGSNTSSSSKFLNQVLPEISVISVGEGNSYGLPKDDVMKRLEKINTNIYRTDRDGTIQIICDGKTNEVVKIDVSFDGK